MIDDDDERDRYLDLGGTVRARDPATTLRWLEPLFPRFGLTRIARVTGLDDVGIAVSMAVRPLSLTLSVSQGKGTTPELSDASGAMESIELWHSENAPAPRLTGSYDDLRSAGHPVIDPVTLRPEGTFQPFGNGLRSRVLGWLDATDLVANEPCLLPRPFCCMASDGDEPVHLVSSVDTTGLAGGNTFEEATCHALCEVIERDAAARFHMLSDEERRARRLDLATITGPARELITRLEQTRLQVMIWHQTSHVGVPTFGCTIEGAAGDVRGLASFGGFGAHLDPEIAVCRATSEAVQSRLTFISGARDDHPPATYHTVQLAALSAAALSSPMPTSNKGTCSFLDAPKRQTTGSFSGDRRLLIQRLVSAGFSKVLRVDLTKPDIGVPVAFVFVPAAMLLDH